MIQTQRYRELRDAVQRDLNEIEAIAKKAERTDADQERIRELSLRLFGDDGDGGTDAQLAEERKVCETLERRAQFERPNGEAIGRYDGDAGEAATRPTRAPSLGRGFATNRIVADYRANPRGKSAPYEVRSFFGPENLWAPEERAVIYGGALAADMVRPQLLAGVVRGNEPIGTRAVRDVLLNGRTNSDSVLFVKENVYTNAAATVAEATTTSDGAKPESSLTFTQDSAPVQVIAHWIPITRQALDDVPMLQSYVEGRLIDGLRREENDQLLNGDGTAPNISGILDQSGLQNLDQTYFTGAAVLNVGATPENFQRVLRGKTLVMTTGDSMATFVIVNPTDWENFIARVDGDLNFYGPGPFSNDTLPRLWGLDVVVTEDKAAGSVLIGDGTAAQVWDRWDARVLIADQHSDFFVRNLFVLLAEERLTLTVYRPAAFALVDLA